MARRAPRWVPRSRPWSGRAAVVVACVLTLAAGAGAGCGGDDEDTGGESIRNMTLAEVVERPPLPGETVGVTGEARPLEDFGFVLSGDGGAIVVRGGEDRVQRGEQVTVVGTVQRITQPLSTRIANALEGTPDTTARTNSGAVYLEFRRVAATD